MFNVAYFLIALKHYATEMHYFIQIHNANA